MTPPSLPHSLPHRTAWMSAASPLASLGNTLASVASSSHSRFAVVLLGCLLSACGGSAEQETTPSDEDIMFPDERAAAEAHHPATPRVAAGERLLVAGDVPGARAEFEAAVTEDSEDARAHLNLGLTQELQNDYDAADASYRRAIEIDPNFSEALNNLGLLLLDQGRPGDAIDLLGRAIESRPGNSDAWLNLAYAKQAARDLSGAREAFAETVALIPSDAVVRVHFGELLLEMDSNAEAVVEFRRAASLADGDSAVLLAAGKGLRRAGQADDAVTILEALSRREEAAVVFAELGIAQQAAGNAEAAVAALTRATELEPEMAVAYFLLGELQEDDNAARAAYERYLELAPEGSFAARAQGRLDELN